MVKWLMPQLNTEDASDYSMRGMLKDVPFLA